LSNTEYKIHNIGNTQSHLVEKQEEIDKGHEAECTLQGRPAPIHVIIREPKVEARDALNSPGEIFDKFFENKNK
jgi:hypothetical protein